MFETAVAGFHRMRRWLPGCLLLVSLDASLCAQNGTSDATHDIIVTRDQVMDRVVDIKKKFKESDTEFREARDRYRKAYAEYNAYIVMVKTAIRKGKTDNLAKNSSYKKTAESASNAARAFTQYADAKLGGPTRGFFLIQALFAQGINIFNAYKDGQAERRAQEADTFEREVKWSRWEEIK
jgi:hypothetical protein